jgi:hypothetical protein
MPFKARPQPSCAELLPVQVEEGLVVVTVVEESGAPPPPVTTTAVEEERTVPEMTAPQAVLEPPTGAGPGGVDVVMVLVDETRRCPSRRGIVMS